MKKWQKISLISFSALLILVLLTVARNRQENTITKTPKIIINDITNSSFLTENELLEKLKRENLIYPGQMYSQLEINKIETFIESIPEVKHVKVFTKMGENWAIDVELRIPIARIFNEKGESYYLDTEGHTMHPSTNHSARVIVATGNIPDRINSQPVSELINNDSLKSIRKLDDVYRISKYVCNDSLLCAQIAQMHINKRGDFILVPQVGGQTINFGTAHSDKEVAEKFEKLKVFYKYGIPYEGWNKYSEIILKYDNQIVAKKRN